MCVSTHSVKCYIQYSILAVHKNIQLSLADISLIYNASLTAERHGHLQCLYIYVSLCVCTHTHTHTPEHARIHSRHKRSTSLHYIYQQKLVITHVVKQHK